MALLQQALTHRSYVNEHNDPDAVDNERLEFLGDAVLSFIAGDMLFREFPNMPEGDLTRLRAAMVRTDSLAQIGLARRVGEALRMGKGEERSGGRTRANNVCAAFEAVIGALYLDQGLDAVRAFVCPLLAERLEQVLSESLHTDARSQLQERAQAELNETPQYVLVDASGPDHERVFTVEVVIGGRVAGSGQGRSKQAASMAAARAALEQFDAVFTPARDDAEPLSG